MSRSCVCEGSNENCRYCGGTGMISDYLGVALDSAVQRLKLENSPTEDIKFSPKQNPPKKSETLRPIRLNTQRKARQYELCPICMAKLRKGRMQRHLSKAHGTTTSNPLTTEAVRGASVTQLKTEGTTSIPESASQSLGARTRCPVCDVTVNVSRLNKHMAKVHKRRPVTFSPAQAPSATDSTLQATTLVAPRDKNLDATKPYAHAYREKGRFGSHPSHDRFDDESGPD